MNRARLLRLLPWLVGLALLILVIGTVSFEEVADVLRRLRLWEIGALAVLNGLVLLTIAGRWYLLLRGQGYVVPFRLLFGYRLAVFGLSYFTPGPHIGGEPLQVLFIEKEQGAPRSAALAAVTLDKALEFAVNFAFLLIGVAAVLRWRILSEEIGREALAVGALLLAVPILYLGASGLGYHPLTRLARPLSRWSYLRRRAARLEAAVGTLQAGEQQIALFFRQSPGTLALAVLVTLLGWAALIAEYWLMVYFLGTPLTLPQLVATLTAARIAILLLLPAGLGALEGSQALSFAALGLDPATGVAVSLLIRLRDTGLGAVGLWWGSRRIQRWARPPEAG